MLTKKGVYCACLVRSDYSDKTNTLNVCFANLT